MGCSNDEVNETFLEDNIAKEVTTTEKWKESEFFTSENLSLIGEQQLVGFSHSDAERIYAKKPGKFGWRFWER